jgi:hypothetical protein
MRLRFFSPKLALLCTLIIAAGVLLAFPVVGIAGYLCSLVVGCARSMGLPVRVGPDLPAIH